MMDLQKYSKEEGFDISALISDIVNNKVSLFEVMLLSLPLVTVL
jgi:hypothetical protein